MDKDASTTESPSASGQGDADVFSDADLAALQARLKANPAAARAFALVQQRGYAFLRRQAEDTMARLAALEPPHKAADPDADWRRYSGLARDREMAARERRLLAQDLVIGALVNIDNPDWDPLDPSTSADSSGSTLLALLDPTLTKPQKSGA